MADLLILKTGSLLEANMLVDALDQERIPHYEKQERGGGGRFAMPALPMQGPGVFFCVFVPEIAAEDARAVLAELPIELEEKGGSDAKASSHPAVLEYRPRPWVKKMIFWYLVIVAVGIVIGAAMEMWGVV